MVYVAADAVKELDPKEYAKLSASGRAVRAQFGPYDGPPQDYNALPSQPKYMTYRQVQIAYLSEAARSRRTPAPTPAQTSAALTPTLPIDDTSSDVTNLVLQSALTSPERRQLGAQRRAHKLRHPNTPWPSLPRTPDVTHMVGDWLPRSDIMPTVQVHNIPEDNVVLLEDLSGVKELWHDAARAHSREIPMSCDGCGLTFPRGQMHRAGLCTYYCPGCWSSGVRAGLSITQWKRQGGSFDACCWPNILMFLVTSAGFLN